MWASTRYESARAVKQDEFCYRSSSPKENLLQQCLLRRDKKFWAYFDAIWPTIPVKPRAPNCAKRFVPDLAARATSAASYRGPLPFGEYRGGIPPTASHVRRRQMVADNKAPPYWNA